MRASKELGRGVTKELVELGMKSARFEIRVVTDADPGSWYEREGKRVRLGPHGAETIEFQLAANPGLPPAPLAKVASGGELSRAMLALKVRLIEVDPADVLVFDEIDAGIGGRTARVVGERLAAIASERQVIAITHLATVACAGESHVRIEKVTAGGTTHVRARRLTDEERVAEIARMLAGAEGDKTAQQHARELLALRGAGGP
jgi:DNA repair protein RecN (Recombination protein N)